MNFSPRSVNEEVDMVRHGSYSSYDRPRRGPGSKPTSGSVGRIFERKRALAEERDRDWRPRRLQEREQDTRRALDNLHLDRRHRGFGHDSRPHGGAPPNRGGRLCSMHVRTPHAGRDGGPNGRQDQPMAGRGRGGGPLLEEGRKMDSWERPSAPPAVATASNHGAGDKAREPGRRGEGRRGDEAAPAERQVGGAQDDGNGGQTRGQLEAEKRPGKNRRAMPRYVEASIEGLRRDLARSTDEIKKTFLDALARAEKERRDIPMSDHHEPGVNPDNLVCLQPQAEEGAVAEAEGTPPGDHGDDGRDAVGPADPLCSSAASPEERPGEEGVSEASEKAQEEEGADFDVELDALYDNPIHLLDD